LIEKFNTLTARKRIDSRKFSQLSNSDIGLGGHNRYKPRCPSTRRQKFFSIRLVNKWNRLPSAVVNVSSLNAFKNQLDEYWKDTGA